MHTVPNNREYLSVRASFKDLWFSLVYITVYIIMHNDIQKVYSKFVGAPFCGGPWAAAHSALS